MTRYRKSASRCSLNEETLPNEFRLSCTHNKKFNFHETKQASFAKGTSTTLLIR